MTVDAAVPTGVASFFFPDVAGSTRNNISRVHDFATAFALEGGEYQLAGRLLGRAEASDGPGDRLQELAGYRARLDDELGDHLGDLVREGEGWSDDEAVDACIRWVDG